MCEPSSGRGAETVWADAHNHLQDPRLAGRDAAAPCMVNATREDDWADVLATVSSAPHRHAALGIHPWFAATAREGWAGRLKHLLETHTQAGIGECGIDSKTRKCPLDIQTPVFIRQIRLARDLDRPLMIHCVGAWGRLFEAFDREDPPARWLLHSFSGSEDTARRLAMMGAYFSINGRALHPAGEKILRVFRKIPPDRILLETDAPNQPPPEQIVTHAMPGGLNDPGNLAAIGKAVAPLLGFEPHDFALLTHRNFKRFRSPNKDLPPCF